MLALGFVFGCLYWAFITGRVGLVGDDDTQYFGRIEHDGAGEG